ncbi:dynamin family protein [Endozoicomonas sp.]|uniref:dynamin family protein n=1 Tax=Endozoicomonas sp. TaxID=1892382 RepID=UPI00383AB6D8
MIIDIQHALENLKAVTQSLDTAEQDYKQIELLQSNIRDKQFYLPIVGQFSAGKSHFINNLLGRMILPYKTTETTSFLTTIRYSETEKFVVKKINGKSLSLDVSAASAFNQQNIASGALQDEISGVAIDDIESLEIHINHQLLADGLVLVDTPGINTLNKAHEAFTHNYLPAAQAFLYVSSGSPSASDINFLQQISDYGLDIIFVRTRMDEIKQSEESYDIAVIGDKIILKDVLDTNKYYFAISNLLTDGDWAMKFAEVRSYINDYFSIGVQQALERSVASKINRYTCAYRKTLEGQLRLLERNFEVCPETFKESVDAINNEIDLLTTDHANLKSALESEFTLVKREVIREIEQHKTNYLNAYRSELVAGDFANTAMQAQQFGNEFLRRFSLELNLSISSRLMRSIELIYKKRNEQFAYLESIGADILIEDYVCQMVAPDFNEMTSKSNEFLSSIALQLQQISNDVERSEIEMSKLSHQAQVLSEDVSIINDDVYESKSTCHELEYVPQYICESGDQTVSKFFGTVGKIADVALMFIPTPVGPAKAVHNTTKVAKAAKKTKQALNIIKSTKQVIDEYKPKIKQAAYDLKEFKTSANNIVGEMAGSDNAKDNSIGDMAFKSLELLDVEFWMRKMGEQFDTPPSTMVDEEHRRRFERKRTEAEQQMLQKVQQQLQKMNELGLLKEKAEYEKKNQDLLDKRKLGLQQELQLIEADYMQEKRQLELTNKCNFYCQRMDESLADYVSGIKSKIDNIIEDFTIKLLLSVMVDGEARLNSFKSQLNTVQESQRLSAVDKSSKVNEIEQLLVMLDGISEGINGN